MKTLAILLVAGLLTLVAGTDSSEAQTLTTLYSFGTKTNSQGENIDGTFPVCVIVGTDGNLYGNCAGGGTNGYGTAFKLSTAGTLTMLHTFCNTIVCPGAPEQPNGMIQGSDGNFYGTTPLGGANNAGAVFKLTSEGTFTTLYSFCSDVVSGICLDGSAPVAPLIEGNDGNFYGTTTGGGSNDEGTVFRITSAGTLTTFYNIPNSLAVGQIYKTPLYQGSDTNFYGVSGIGGDTGDGLIFQLTPQGTLTVLYNFCNETNGCRDGNEPLASVIEVSGNLYGTALGGGVYNIEGGTVWQCPLGGAPDGSLIPLHTFCSDGCLDGNEPAAALLLGSDGNFYSTTSEGGTGGGGTVFQLTPAGQLTTLHSFCTVTNAGNVCVDGAMEGAHKGAAMVQGQDGNFYGVTEGGGTHGFGVVFKLDMGLGGSGGGTNCTYSINPTNDAFNAGGGSGSVSVTTSNGCAWTAVSNDGFITITSGSSGAGNGTVHYSVAANTGSAQLTGTVTIADQTLTVIEAGASAASVATPTITPDGGDLADSVKVTLKCATKKTIIYYTIDGSEPTTSSLKYKSAITLTNSATLNAVAYVGASSSAEATASFTISRPSITTPALLPEATAGTEYSTTLTATGGTAPYKWKLLTSKLPVGLKLSSTGVISGTAKTASTGPVAFTVELTDAKKGIAKQSFTLTVE